MEGLVLPMAANISAATPCSSSSSVSTNASLLFPRLVTRTRWRTSGNLNFRRKPTKFSIFAAKEDPQFDQWDQVALKFGKMIGEDPKLTMAKIKAKKLNPDATFIEIEKSLRRNNGKVVELKEVPFEGSKNAQSSSSVAGVNMVRPVPKKGVKFESDKVVELNEVPFEGSKNAQSSSSVAGVNLVRPVPKKGVKFESDNSKPRISELKKPVQPTEGPVDSGARSSVPNILLRKPSVSNEDDVEDKPSKLRIRRNLSLSMTSQPEKENFSDMTLLRKPEPVIVKGESGEENEVEASEEEMEEEPDELTTPIRKPEAYATIKEDEEQSEDVEVNEKVEEQPNESILIRKPEAYSMKEQDEEQLEDVEIDKEEVEEEPNESTLIRKPEAFATTEEDEEQSEDESQLRNQIRLGFSDEETSANRMLDTETADSVLDAVVSSLLKKPMRLEERQGLSTNERVEAMPVISERSVNDFEFGDPSASSEFKESEDADWERAETLVKTGQRGDVELLSSSSRGFVVSFGSLVGFLPYRNLSAKYKFLAFESWLRHKRLDPAKYKHNLSVIGIYDLANDNDSVNGGGSDPQLDKNVSWEVSPNTKLEDLLRVYDQQKIKFLSSFIGQKVKANVIVADRKFRKLLFSVKPKEKEELVEKKKSLMARLQIGDVVKCCIKKITYFGIFVEVEGVNALIHQTEVSWDSTLDPTAFYKIGQIVEAKVHQLDFPMERIFLSLKEITPDPLVEALESVVSESNPLDGDLQAAAQVETQWAEVDSLIKELQQIEGVTSVSKGRFFISPGLAPTFQVYMASMFENQYKLLARAENRVQELIVESSLDKEEIKSVILTCTNRVE